MKVLFHPHARQRMIERGVTESEVVATVEHGERIPANFNRTGFRRNFPFQGTWRGKDYFSKQVHAVAVPQDIDWLVITVIARYY